MQAAEGGDGDVLLIYETENLSPLITQDFLDGQQAKLPANVFSREHQNLWGSGSDTFCQLDDWKRATAGDSPLRVEDTGPCYALCDLGWVHDETAIAVSKRLEDNFHILALETFKGSKSNPLRLPKVENRLRELAETYNIRRIEIESPQGVQMSQQLQIPGCSVNVLHPTAKSNRERWGALYTALRNGTVRLPRDSKLRRQLLTLTIKEGLSGWRVVDVPSVHNDRAVAVAGAVFLAQEKVFTPLPEQPTQKSRWTGIGESGGRFVEYPVPSFGGRMSGSKWFRY
jgi:hypothetical protein